MFFLWLKNMIMNKIFSMILGWLFFMILLVLLFLDGTNIIWIYYDGQNSFSFPFDFPSTHPTSQNITAKAFSWEFVQTTTSHITQTSESEPAIASLKSPANFQEVDLVSSNKSPSSVTNDENKKELASLLLATSSGCWAMQNLQFYSRNIEYFSCKAPPSKTQ